MLCYLVKGEGCMLKVGIQLNDRDFSRALARGLTVHSRNIYFVVLEEGDKDDDLDLILSDRQRDGNSNLYVYLSCSPEEEHIYDGPPYILFRYKPADRFLGDLLFIHYCLSGKNMEYIGDSHCKILVFASLSGGMDATALSLATGQLMYKHFGQKCLYINLCPIDGSKRFLPEGTGKGLLSLLYYLEQKKDFPLSSFIAESQHIDYIETTISNPYFDEMVPALCHHLLKKIDQLGRYEYLILDIGNHLSRGNKELLPYGESLFYVVSGGDCLHSSFLSKSSTMLEAFAGDTPVHAISLEIKPAECEELHLLENGLLDLSAMKWVWWEAGRLVKEIMESVNHD